MILRTQTDATERTAAIARFIVLVLTVAVAIGAYACETPVFQYALENWEADAYEVTVFHRGELSTAERKAVALLRNGADHRGGHGNLLVETVDLAARPDAIMLQRWRDQGTTKLPWMVAGYPSVKRLTVPAWSGPLNVANARGLLASPLRRKIADELTQRVTASWVLLESGNRGKDNAAAALLKRELARLEKTLVPSVLEGWGADAAATEPQRARFTLHRVSRDSSEEQVFVNMLLHSESDLATEFAREPLAFPIYGRGLILYALAGAGINDWTIMKAAEFITGSCSCEVKAGNPGTDILVMQDWNALVKQTAQERMPPPVGMASFQDRAAEAERRLAEVDEAHATAGASLSGGVAQPPATATSDAPARSTLPRELDAGVAAPSTELAGSTEPAAPSPAAPLVAEPTEPTAGETEEAAATGEAPAEPTEETPVDDDLDDQAALARGGSGPEEGGVARLVGVLALIAAAITGSVTAAVVFRRRRNAVRDEEHERIPT